MAKPTRKQLAYLRALAEATGTTFTPRRTKAEASDPIAAPKRQARSTRTERHTELRRTPSRPPRSLGDGRSATTKRPDTGQAPVARMARGDTSRPRPSDRADLLDADQASAGQITRLLLAATSWASHEDIACSNANLTQNQLVPASSRAKRPAPPGDQQPSPVYTATNDTRGQREPHGLHAGRDRRLGWAVPQGDIPCDRNGRTPGGPCMQRQPPAHPIGGGARMDRATPCRRTEKFARQHSSSPIQTRYDPRLERSPQYSRWARGGTIGSAQGAPPRTTPAPAWCSSSRSHRARHAARHTNAPVTPPDTARRLGSGSR